jgi:putative tryptophan/tyrosine transport system substrate-binding protein
LAIEYRWAAGQYDRLPALAADLVSRQVAVIVTTGGEPSALAAKAATTTIPIVFNIGGDPVKLGLVARFNQPGGNATGVSLLTSELEAKRLGLLHELMPKAALIAVLVNPNFQQAETQSREVQEAARTIGQQILILKASNERDVDKAFAPSSKNGPMHSSSPPILSSPIGAVSSLRWRHATPNPVRAFF